MCRDLAQLSTYVQHHHGHVIALPVDGWYVDVSSEIREPSRRSVVVGHLRYRDTPAAGLLLINEDGSFVAETAGRPARTLAPGVSALCRQEQIPHLLDGLVGVSQ